MVVQRPILSPGMHVPYQGGTNLQARRIATSVRTLSTAVLGQTHMSKQCPLNTHTRRYEYRPHPSRGTNNNSRRN
jgi:hypothetical protein